MQLLLAATEPSEKEIEAAPARGAKGGGPQPEGVAGGWAAAGGPGAGRAGHDHRAGAGRQVVVEAQVAEGDRVRVADGEGQRRGPTDRSRIRRKRLGDRDQGRVDDGRDPGAGGEIAVLVVSSSSEVLDQGVQGLAGASPP